MYKIVILFSLFTTFVFSATSQQVDQYMSTTHSDRNLIEIEQMFSNLSETVDLSDDNISEQITLAYQIYLGKHISEDEMEELLALYRKPIMQQYINEMDMIDIPQEEMENFLLALKEEPLSTERQDIVDELLKSIINEELLLNFYDSMMQRYSIKKDDNQTKEKSKESNSSKKVPTKQEQKFLDIMKKGIKQELLYGTQVLSLEEMQKVNKVIKSSVITKAKRVENEAIINIMNSFIKRIISEPKKVEKK
jgi:hypothetical protein